jgi:lincosamide nucleotidyltransferase A/C/D/E
MEPERVIAIVSTLEAAGIGVWLDGGWGVDALVGQQTRTHADLDLAIDRRDLERIQRKLEELGFTADPTVEPGLPARLVMKDGRGDEVDLHPLVFDKTGNGWQQLAPDGREWGRYPADDLKAHGTVAGHRVMCLSAALQLRFHLGYQWSDRDRHDVRQLQQRFGVGPPLTDPPGNES